MRYTRQESVIISWQEQAGQEFPPHMDGPESRGDNIRSFYSILFYLELENRKVWFTAQFYSEDGQVDGGELRFLKASSRGATETDPIIDIPPGEMSLHNSTFCLPQLFIGWQFETVCEPFTSSVAFILWRVSYLSRLCRISTVVQCWFWQRCRGGSSDRDATQDIASVYAHLRWFQIFDPQRHPLRESARVQGGGRPRNKESTRVHLLLNFHQL